jgi:uncharacterized protein (TIGR00251 family)
MAIFKELNGAVTFAVKVVPRASKNQVAGIEGDAIKIRLNAPPVDGKANAALIEFLADGLNLSRSQIEIVTGHTSRHKVVRIRGATLKQIEGKLKSDL